MSQIQTDILKIPSDEIRNFRVYETLKIIHYIEAADEVSARDCVDKMREKIFQIPSMRAADLDGATITKIVPYDPEG